MVDLNYLSLTYYPPANLYLYVLYIYLFLQLVRLNSAGQLSIGERCVDVDSQGVKLIFCRLGTVDGPWVYDEVSPTTWWV